MAPEESVEVLRAVWAANGSADDFEDCGPAKVCRNMKDFSFDDMAEPGTDLGAAWRERLRREGKLGSSGSVGDLVLGSSDD
jgi:hypothetical protein